jgi:hypothetical protein
MHSAEEGSTLDAKESSAKNPKRIDAGIRRLSEELNREDSQLRIREDTGGGVPRHSQPG